MSAEATAINELLSKSKTEGTQVLRERRKLSKEGKEGMAAKPKEKNTNAHVGFAEPKPMSAEAKEINRRIDEDRRVRRASKELEDAERVALERVHALNRQVEAAEAEAEEQALGQAAALAGAAARGAAKAACLKAGGVFVPNNEWINAQERIKELEEEVKKLREERAASQGIMKRLSGLMKQHYGDSGREVSGREEEKDMSSPTRKLRRQKSSDGSSFVRKVLDAGHESFVSKVMRSASPNVLRRSNSKTNLGREAPAFILASTSA